MASLIGVQKYISHWPFLKQRICELLVSAVSLLLTAGLVSESGQGSRRWIWQTRPLNSERSCRICDCGWISASFQKFNNVWVGSLHGYRQSCVSILLVIEGKKWNVNNTERYVCGLWGWSHVSQPAHAGISLICVDPIVIVWNGHTEIGVNSKKNKKVSMLFPLL